MARNAGIIVAIVGVIFMSYCIFVGVWTIIGKNVTIFHLTHHDDGDVLVLAYSVAHFLISMIGLVGLLGGYSSKKGLLRGFIVQLWLATAVLTVVSVLNVFASRSWELTTIKNCISASRTTDSSCPAQVEAAQGAAFINAIAQGSALGLLSLINTICGVSAIRSMAATEDQKDQLAKAFNAERPKDGKLFRSGSNAVAPMATAAGGPRQQQERYYDYSAPQQYRSASPAPSVASDHSAFQARQPTVARTMAANLTRMGMYGTD